MKVHAPFQPEGGAYGDDDHHHDHNRDGHRHE
jgi:urease accessory protein UreE